MKMSTNQLFELYGHLAKVQGNYVRVVGVMAIVSFNNSGYTTVAEARDIHGEHRFLVMKGK